MARGISDELRNQAALLAGEIHSTKWQLPEGFDEVRFDALGLRPRKWKLPVSQRLAVISPFCSVEALKPSPRRVPIPCY
jgi:hypothetical protein